MSKKRTKKVKAEKDKELKEQLARALADYDNLQKRLDRERENLGRIVSSQVVVKLLPILDMLSDIQEHLKDSGLSIAIKEFEDALKELDVVGIEASAGTRFDENLHECVEVVSKKGIADGEIVECSLSGWKFKDTDIIIRPAKVIVNRKENTK